MTKKKKGRLTKDGRIVPLAVWEAVRRDLGCVRQHCPTEGTQACYAFHEPHYAKVYAWLIGGHVTTCGGSERVHSGARPTTNQPKEVSNG